VPEPYRLLSNSSISPAEQTPNIRCALSAGTEQLPNEGSHLSARVAVRR
jgi:hypothetical protein